jgi:carbonic anhydrase
MAHIQRNCSREAFLGRAGLGFACAAFAGEALSATTAAGASGSAGGPPMAANSPAEALAMLKAGNARFAAGKPICGSQTARIHELERGQSPFAIALGCSDSREPIETIFDQIPGNIFVVRVAGNFLNNANYGSIEYAVAHLKSKLILVLGHTHCGAVTAAVEFAKDGTKEPGHIADLITETLPAVEATRGRAGDWLENAIAENVKRNVAALTSGSKIIADAVANGHVKVTGGIYDLHTGRASISTPA